MGSYRHFTEVFFVVELIPKITSRTKRTNGTKYNWSCKNLREMCGIMVMNSAANSALWKTSPPLIFPTQHTSFDLPTSNTANHTWSTTTVLASLPCPSPMFPHTIKPGDLQPTLAACLLQRRTLIPALFHCRFRSHSVIWENLICMVQRLHFLTTLCRRKSLSINRRATTFRMRLIYRFIFP